MMEDQDNPYQAPATTAAAKRRPILIWAAMIVVPMILFAASWYVACKDLDRDALPFRDLNGEEHLIHPQPNTNFNKFPIPGSFLKWKKPWLTSSELLQNKFAAWLRTWYIWTAWIVAVFVFEWWAIRRLKTE